MYDAVLARPLSVDDTDVHLAQDCRYVVATPRGRLEILEVVGG